MHRNWRDCQEWKDLGFNFSTTSNEAVKLYDASISQWTGYYDDPSVGGLHDTLIKLEAADPNWVIGQVLCNGLELLGGRLDRRNDPMFYSKLDKLYTLAESTVISNSEKGHVAALKAFAEGEFESACSVWESVLVKNPFDVMALQFLNSLNFFMGNMAQIRDSVTRILPSWKSGMPLYSHLLGIQAFGLVETNFFEQAEKTGKMALEMNPFDQWATHSVAHVYELTGRPARGIEFLNSLERYWSKPTRLVCHLNWHMALYHIENGDYENALGLFDKEVTVTTFQNGTVMINNAMVSGALFRMMDVASLLFRLELEGVDVGNRWDEVIKLVRPHVQNNLPLAPSHVMISCVGAKHTDTATKLRQSLETLINKGSGTNHRIAKEVNGKLCEALASYGEGNYATAVEIIYPLRYNIWQIGGSRVSRDVFNLLLIQSAILSDQPEHHALARQLLAERNLLRAESPMAERLMSKALAADAN